MQQNPISDKTNQPVHASLAQSLETIGAALRMPQNQDAVIRRLKVSGFDIAVVFLGGMVSQHHLDLHVISPAMLSTYNGAPEQRVDWLVDSVLTVGEIRVLNQIDELVSCILSGDAAVFVDGCPRAISVDVKGYQRRAIQIPFNEATIVGPHEAFVESMKTNVTMIRRALLSPRLVAEHIQVGNGIQTTCALLYLDGVTNEQILTELRRRLNGINVDYVQSAGELEQLIEDSPFALLPQIVHTERPDRAASFLISGMPVLFLEGTPVALSIPVSLLHLLHTPDMSSLRFPYGVFKRLVLVFGIIVTSVLPAMIIAVTLYHNDLLPLALITSLFETESRIPIPLFYELVFLNIGFDLILEASMRMPAALTSGLGAIAALILGQAVVIADLVSPLLIVIVALSGLGSLLLPDYRLSLGLRMFQLILTFIAAIGGFYAILLALVIGGVELFSMTSMGVPMLWVVSPGRMGNPDLVIRYPTWQQRVRHYLSNPAQFLRARGRMRAWEKPEEDADE